jgi:hypothetical protein
MTAPWNRNLALTTLYSSSGSYLAASLPKYSRVADLHSAALFPADLASR